MRGTKSPRHDTDTQEQFRSHFWLKPCPVRTCAWFSCVTSFIGYVLSNCLQHCYCVFRQLSCLFLACTTRQTRNCLLGRLGSTMEEQIKEIRIIIALVLRARTERFHIRQSHSDDYQRCGHPYDQGRRDRAKHQRTRSPHLRSGSWKRFCLRRLWISSRILALAAKSWWFHCYRVP